MTAYDGGKVGVLGGGVKLGGGGNGASGPTSPRKPRTHNHGQQQQHHRSRSGHRLHYGAGAGPFGQPMFAAPASVGGYPPMPPQQHGFSGVFNVGF